MIPYVPGESDTAALLVARSLTTGFPTSRGIVRAVDDVSLTLARGETVGIVGESGSGKSALVRSLMRLTPKHAVTSGQVLFEGRDLRQLSPKEVRRLWGRDISMIFQDPLTALNPVLRIGRHLTETITLHTGVNARQAQQRALELLTLVGVPDPERRLGQYPHEMSGGMRQRICIALAITCTPKLLFADEPTTALDVTIQRQILDLLKSLQGQQDAMAMVLITHDLGVVARRADRTIVMYAGRIVESGPTAQLFARTRHPYTAALLASIPRLEHRSHTPLAVIPGRPADVIDPAPGCRFAPRCTHAQPMCLHEDPASTTDGDEHHSFACFYPVGTPRGAQAREANVENGRTAAGLEVGTVPQVSV